MYVMPLFNLIKHNRRQCFFDEDLGLKIVEKKNSARKWLEDVFKVVLEDIFKPGKKIIFFSGHLCLTVVHTVQRTLYSAADETHNTVQIPGGGA